MEKIAFPECVRAKAYLQSFTTPSWNHALDTGIERLEMADKAWNARAWTKYQSGKQTLGWQKHRAPYRYDANVLQTLDIWIPYSKQAPNAPAAEAIPSRPGPWIIYIHGGAWRDPLVDASSFDATVKCLLSDQKGAGGIGGIVSLNYSVSPHPQHPTHPSPPQDPSQEKDPSRLVQHPQHILDVLTALEFLQQKARFGSNYILVGHSCGATLAFQVAMNAQTWKLGSDLPLMRKPEVIIGLNGLYDLPRLVKDPGNKHKHLIPIYDAFTKGAFSEDEKIWQQVSPISVPDWAKQWAVGSKVVFAQSKEDSLVPYAQTAEMMKVLTQSKAFCLKLVEEEIDGDHNEIWQKGDKLAEMLEEIVREM